MTLENVNFGDLSLGFTWLLRFKRHPKVPSSLFENFDCDSLSYGAAVWEFRKIGKFFFGSARQFHPTRLVGPADAIVTSDPNEFVNFSVTGVPVAVNYSLYHNGHFVNDVTEEADDNGNRKPNFRCFSLMHRPPMSYATAGTVRIVAVADDVMTESEINKFLEIVDE
jgi:hypothetical protein